MFDEADNSGGTAQAAAPTLFNRIWWFAATHPRAAIITFATSLVLNLIQAVL